VSEQESVQNFMQPLGSSKHGFRHL